MNINETCGVDKSVLGTKGDGCLEALSVMLVLAKKGFKFTSVADFKSKAKWDEAIKAGNIVPLYEHYELANNNTDATFYETREFRYKTQEAIKAFTVEYYISLCQTAALRSYEDSEYSTFFRVLEDGAIQGVYDEGGVKGQSIKNFAVGQRDEPVADKPATVMAYITVSDFNELEGNSVIVNPDFDPLVDIERVAQVAMTVNSASSTTVEVAVATGCNGIIVEGLQASDFKLYDGNGTEQTVDSVNEATPGVYTITGTALVSGTVSLNGIVEVATELYQSGEYPFTVS